MGALVRGCVKPKIDILTNSKLEGGLEFPAAIALAELSRCADLVVQPAHSAVKQTITQREGET